MLQNFVIVLISKSSKSNLIESVPLNLPALSSFDTNMFKVT